MLSRKEKKKSGLKGHSHHFFIRNFDFREWLSKAAVTAKVVTKRFQDST